MSELRPGGPVSKLFGETPTDFYQFKDREKCVPNLLLLLERLNPSVFHNSHGMPMNPSSLARLIKARLWRNDEMTQAGIAPGYNWTELDQIPPNAPCIELDYTKQLARLRIEFDITDIIPHAMGGWPVPSPCKECLVECPLKGIQQGIGKLNQAVKQPGVIENWENLKTDDPYLLADNYVDQIQSNRQFLAYNSLNHFPANAIERIRGIRDSEDPESEINIQNPNFRDIIVFSWITSATRAYKARAITPDDLLFLFDSTISPLELRGMIGNSLQGFIGSFGPSRLAIYQRLAADNSLDGFTQQCSKDMNEADIKRMYYLMKTLNRFRFVRVPKELIVGSDERYIKTTDHERPGFFMTKVTHTVFEYCAQKLLDARRSASISGMIFKRQQEFPKTIKEVSFTQGEIASHGQQVYGDGFYTSTVEGANPDEQTLTSTLNAMKCMERTIETYPVKKGKSKRKPPITTYQPQFDPLFPDPTVDSDEVKHPPKSPREIANELYPFQCGGCDHKANCYRLRIAQAKRMRGQVLEYCRNLEDKYYRYLLFYEVMTLFTQRDRSIDGQREQRQLTIN